MADPTAPMPAADSASEPVDGSAPADDSGAGPTVLCTILDNGDGTWTLAVPGGDDESAEGDAGDGAGMAGGDASGAGAAPAVGGLDAGEGSASGGAPQGQTFDSPGALLKGVLTLLNDTQAKASGDGTADDNFSAGFSGGSAASPPKQTLASKY